MSWNGSRRSSSSYEQPSRRSRGRTPSSRSAATRWPSRKPKLAARERALATKEGPPAGNLDALEARIRRLEQGGRKREAEPQTFSAGLRALQERGLRGNQASDEPLH